MPNNGEHRYKNISRNRRHTFWVIFLNQYSIVLIPNLVSRKQQSPEAGS
jgi:hypothetical protein